MFNLRGLAFIFTPIVFMLSGCNNVQATAADASSLNRASSNLVQEKPASANKVSQSNKIRGQFKRSFEIHELQANGKLYYVSDPKQLLMVYAETINQRGYYKLFDVCVVGDISSNGKYGPLGRYQNQISIQELC